MQADELEDAVLRALTGLYVRTDLWEQAAGTTWRQSQAERDANRPNSTSSRQIVTRAERAIERYLLAFEAGTLPEDQCGTRIRSLSANIAELRDRRGEMLVPHDGVRSGVQALLGQLLAQPHDQLDRRGGQRLG